MSFAVRDLAHDSPGWLPTYASRDEADALIDHVRRLNPDADLRVEESDTLPTHIIRDRRLMRPTAHPEAPWEIVGVSEAPSDEGPAGYSDALLAELAATSERGDLAFIDGARVSPSQEFQSTGIITVVAPESTTLWHVSLALDTSIDAARFLVDMDETMITAPGMFPDPKPGYVMWEGDPGDARVGMVWQDPDTNGIESGIVESFAGRLPSVSEGRASSDDLVDLAHLVLRSALGWIELKVIGSEGGGLVDSPNNEELDEEAQTGYSAEERIQYGGAIQRLGATLIIAGGRMMTGGGPEPFEGMTPENENTLTAIARALQESMLMEAATPTADQRERMRDN